MAISEIQMYVAFQKLFKDSQAAKKDVLSFGVSEDEFLSVDMDQNEYLGIDEALRNDNITDLLYSNMVSTYGERAATEANQANDAAKRNGGQPIIDLKNPSKNNPFA